MYPGWKSDILYKNLLYDVQNTTLEGVRFCQVEENKKEKSIDPMTDASFAFPYFHASHSAYQSVSVRFVILLPVESDFALSIPSIQSAR